MNRQEFLDTCKKCGYINMDIAKDYAKNIDKFGDSDFETCTKLTYKGSNIDHSARFKNYCGCKSTKSFCFKGSDR